MVDRAGAIKWVDAKCSKCKRKWKIATTPVDPGGDLSVTHKCDCGRWMTVDRPYSTKFILHYYNPIEPHPLPYSGY
jgi:hypothetical protein